MFRAQVPSDPMAFLQVDDISGDLSTQPGLADSYVEALESLHRFGARVTVRNWAATLCAQWA